MVGNHRFVFIEVDRGSGFKGFILQLFACNNAKLEETFGAVLILYPFLTGSGQVNSVECKYGAFFIFNQLPASPLFFCQAIAGRAKRRHICNLYRTGV